MEDNGKLIQLLCVMLADQQLQFLAAECLLIITSRKVLFVFEEYFQLLNESCGLELRYELK